MLLCQTIGQQHIANVPREGNVERPAGMHVPDLRAPEAILCATKAVRMRRHPHPRHNFPIKMFDRCHLSSLNIAFDARETRVDSQVWRSNFLHVSLGGRTGIANCNSALSGFFADAKPVPSASKSVHYSMQTRN